MAFEPVKLDDAKRAELEQAHEDILVLRGGDMAPWLVVLRRPNRKETVGYKRAVKMEDEEANYEFVKRICVFPDEAKFDEQLDRWGLFVDGIAMSPSFKQFIGLAAQAQVKT